MPASWPECPLRKRRQARVNDQDERKAVATPRVPIHPAREYPVITHSSVSCGRLSGVGRQRIYALTFRSDGQETIHSFRCRRPIRILRSCKTP